MKIENELRTFWYSILDKHNNETEFGTIEAKDMYQAGKIISSKNGPWKQDKSLYLFESEAAYKFYIKRNNLECLDIDKNMIPI